jgi:hypothetical protein
MPLRCRIGINTSRLFDRRAEGSKIALDAAFVVEPDDPFQPKSSSTDE